jgi:hypothetical protein
MKTVAVVAWREIVEHRMFIAAALGALAVTLVVPLIPAYLGWSATDVREVLMWSMALGFTWLSAVFLGASMVTGTVAAGRFGFFLARPAGSAAIWFGKLLGVLAVLLTCQLLVIAPAALVPGMTDLFDNRTGLGWDVSDLLAVGTVVAVPALLVLLAHSVATVWRGGTAWVVVDVVAFAVAVALGWMSIGPLLRVGAEDAAIVVGLLLVGGLALSTVVAGVVQIAAGRGDGRRQHRVFSSVMWPTLVSVSVAAAGFSIWLMHPSAGHLTGFQQLVMQPNGAWIAVSVPARERWAVPASFALDLDGGRSVRLAVGPSERGQTAVFSSDGRVAAWAIRDSSLWRIRYGYLDELPDGAKDSTIFVERQPVFSLSGDGRILAMIDDGTLVVAALDTGDLIGSARLPSAGQQIAPYFAGEGRVRVLILMDSASAQEPSLRALEFDCGQRTLTETGILAGAGSWLVVTIDEARDRLLLGTVVDGERTYRYVDGRTLNAISWSEGQELGTLVRMLADGRLLRLVGEGDERRLERLTPTGEINAKVRLSGSPQHVVIGAEPSASNVVVAVTDREYGDREREDWLLRLIDLESGEVREIGHGLPAAAYNWGEVKSPPTIGSPATRLFLGKADFLWLWDPVGGQMKPAVRGKG